MLHGNEAVMTQDQIERLIAAASGNGGGNITIKLELTQDAFSKATIEETGRNVSLRGII